jgi:SAM-dependent methyltransferase
MPTCRHCSTPLTHTLVDLGLSPLSNSYVPLAQAADQDPQYPLHARVCSNCLLVQVDDVVPAEDIFTADYAYFSSFSESWLAHAKAYADQMTESLSLDSDSLVVEIASNDGYLLQYFAEKAIPVLGIEPAANTAEVAEAKGVPSLVEFFTEDLAKKLRAEGKRPDLIASANVLAHVPDINDFVRGVAALLDGNAVYTVEFPHLMNLIQQVQFDTIYHEHYSYLSLVAIEHVFDSAGLRVFDVEQLPTHGGSLRVFACLQGADHPQLPGVDRVREAEKAAGMHDLSGYEGFTAQVEQVREEVLAFLNQAHVEGKKVAAYGAAAKGNTLLNYCGVGPDLIEFCVDKNPAKQNTLLPGSHIPVKPVEAILEARPDYAFILPWNLKAEISAQLKDLADTGTHFVTAIPHVLVN